MATSTTRHLVNRQRRLAATRADQAALPPAAVPDRKARLDQRAAPGRKAKQARDAAPVRKPARARRAVTALSRGHRLLLALVAVLASSFAVLSHSRAADLRDVRALHNTALTDTATTSEIKGVVNKSVNEVFSFDYTKPKDTDRAAREHLTGKAVGQHKDMLVQVRAHGDKQKLVLTTTVTHSAVELIEGDRARVLVFADQSNVSTAKGGPKASAPAMFAVDVRQKGGTWRITNIDTFRR